MENGKHAGDTNEPRHETIFHFISSFRRWRRAHTGRESASERMGNVCLEMNFPPLILAKYERKELTVCCYRVE